MSYSARIVPALESIDPLEWEGLDHGHNPFLSHAFLAGLESSESVGPHIGWQPHHLAIYENEKLAALAPSYLKSNSHGEFVFDWAWADAYHRHGLDYYPKLLTAVPYSPVTGTRLLVRKDHAEPTGLRQRLIAFAREECARSGYSSWHCNFTSDDDDAVCSDSNLLERSDWQFHWRNRGYQSFDEFLTQLRSRKRKNIRRERRSVLDAGIEFEWKTGDEVDTEDIALIYRCYASTFHAYGNHPALNEAFFRTIARGLADRFLVSFASLGGDRVAMSLFLSGGGRLYGRYWGCVHDIPGLHFEAAYYQGIEHCIRNGIGVFESGAQGEHKVARGFMPSRTRSWHHIGNDAFRNAISEFLSRESQLLDEYREQLLSHSPFRQDLP